MHGSQQDVVISAPYGAMVKIGNKMQQGQGTVRVDRNKSYTVTMDKDGKTFVCGQINNSLSTGILILDILTYGVGVVVDAITGGWYNLEPTQITCQA